MNRPEIFLICLLLAGCGGGGTSSGGIFENPTIDLTGAWKGELTWLAPLGPIGSGAVVKKLPATMALTQREDVVFGLISISGCFPTGQIEASKLRRVSGENYHYFHLSATSEGRAVRAFPWCSIDDPNPNRMNCVVDITREVDSCPKKDAIAPILTFNRDN